MGRLPRERPQKLAARWLKIRQRFGMVADTDEQGAALKVHYASISQLRPGRGSIADSVAGAMLRLARVSMETTC